ncbi:RGG repeats nuclear RNA binding protein A isoform X2 [Brassica rapa]|uniref:RGG repeats nuclear RNA binding protein A isoform X2 n=1 Tax=Brassica campestris TaxID=3711 RepID=UPI0004F18B19|nr:RGG repeats nuclear RNA binding protein A isoform X2 [Brassica rapa]
MLHAAVDVVVVETEDLAVVVVVTTVILEAVMVTVEDTISPLRKEGFQSLSLRNVVAGEGERPRRTFERRSGTGRGGDFKREGAGRGNWGTPGEEVLVVETEEVAGAEIEKPAGDEVVADAKKENAAEVEEQKEPEDKEMTLDEYEKILEEKKKSLQSQTTSERKVDTKVFESMQQLSNKKKSNDEIFIKLGSDKDKRKDDKEEKAKKAVSINEFLKPAEGENYYRGGGRGGGRGRGRGGRDRGVVSGGGFDGYRSEAAPAIGDTAQFPSLGGK